MKRKQLLRNRHQRMKNIYAIHNIRLFILASKVFTPKRRLKINWFSAIEIKMYNCSLFKNHLQYRNKMLT